MHQLTGELYWISFGISRSIFKLRQLHLLHTAVTNSLLLVPGKPRFRQYIFTVPHLYTEPPKRGKKSFKILPRALGIISNKQDLVVYSHDRSISRMMLLCDSSIIK